jgi:hypothetical protein
MLNKGDYIKDLRDIKRRAIRNQNYRPEDDLAYLISKYNMDWEYVWKKIKQLLTVN